MNRLHGTLLPLHCACMVSDSYILRLLLQKGARVRSRLISVKTIGIQHRSISVNIVSSRDSEGSTGFAQA